jgi:hypothetical protein
MRGVRQRQDIKFLGSLEITLSVTLTILGVKYSDQTLPSAVSRLYTGTFSL